MSQIISKKLANQEIKQYMTNFSKAKGDLSKLADKVSHQYYNSPEISFIFEKNVIEALWSLNHAANALRVYYGSHPDGNPTLVLIPCVISSETLTTKTLTAKNLLYSDDNAAGEWPTGITNKVSENAEKQAIAAAIGKPELKASLPAAEQEKVAEEKDNHAIDNFDISADNF